MAHQAADSSWHWARFAGAAAGILAYSLWASGAHADTFDTILSAAPGVSAPGSAAYTPILMYHQIDSRAGRYAVSLGQFTAQMQWLRANGYEAVSVDQIAAAVRGEATLPEKRVAITFDDGWKSQFTKAKPVLDAVGYKATFYLVTSYIGRPSAYMSWDDVRQLAAEGHWIGSHSVTHRSATRLPSAEAAREMTDSRNAIAAQIGRAATTYSYPYGARNRTVQALAQAAGYTSAVATGAALSYDIGRLFSLPRIEIQAGFSLPEFAGWVTGRPIRIPARVQPSATPIPSPEPVGPPAHSH